MSAEPLDNGVVFEYLSPEKRLDAIADVLAGIALRSIENDKEQSHDPENT
jgi:hypothetical protein